MGHGPLIIRTDGNAVIGSGHIMRCSAIAREAVALGRDVLFAVSDGDSAAMVRNLGFRCGVLSGDCRRFTANDAEALRLLARHVGASALLVDSYAVNQSFLERLGISELRVTYIDDAYTFESGFDAMPKAKEVDAVINYSFGFSLADYRLAYGERTECFVGPQYAPVRQVFANRSYRIRDTVGSVLLTSGATNPNRTLERMAESCLEVFPDAMIIVIVGKLAHFDEAILKSANHVIHTDVQDMAELMLESDIAVAAAGTTLYELSCIGVPTVAVPIVDNQVGNAQGVQALGIGVGLKSVQWTNLQVSDAILRLSPLAIRKRHSELARSYVDGGGARRIARIAVGEG